MPGSSFADHFSDTAAAYAAFRPDYPPRLFAWLAGVVPGVSRAWDCATGSGQAAVRLAEHFREVVATDASTAQLASARPHPRVTYRHALAEASGLARASVDLVTVAQALHWFPIPAFLAEAHRVLRPGGILAVWGYGRIVADDASVAARLDAFHDGTVGPYWPPERALLEDGYRGVDLPGDAVAPPEPFEMSVAWPLEALLGYLGTWSATRRYAQARGEDPVAAFAPSLAAAWGDPERPRRLRWPLAFRAVRMPVNP